MLERESEACSPSPCNNTWLLSLPSHSPCAVCSGNNGLQTFIRGRGAGVMVTDGRADGQRRLAKRLAKKAVIARISFLFGQFPLFKFRLRRWRLTSYSATPPCSPGRRTNFVVGSSHDEILGKGPPARARRRPRPGQRARFFYVNRVGKSKSRVISTMLIINTYIPFSIKKGQNQTKYPMLSVSFSLHCSAGNTVDLRRRCAPAARARPMDGSFVSNRDSPCHCRQKGGRKGQPPSPSFLLQPTGTGRKFLRHSSTPSQVARMMTDSCAHVKKEREG